MNGRSEGIYWATDISPQSIVEWPGYGQVAVILSELVACRNSLNVFEVRSRSYRLLESMDAGGEVSTGLSA